MRFLISSLWGHRSVVLSPGGTRQPVRLCRQCHPCFFAPLQFQCQPPCQSMTEDLSAQGRKRRMVRFGMARQGLTAAVMARSASVEVV